MELQHDDKKLIVVRDRRKFNQFTVHNVVIDHWLPIIGSTGFLLYSFYCRLSSKGEEKAYPGYSLMQKHLKLGRGSISENNKLLAWCGLIHIEEGNRSKANHYYILAVPEVTAERIDAIRAALLADAERRKMDRLALADKLEKETAVFENKGGSVAEQLKWVKKLRAETADKFVLMVSARLDGWRPISDYWQSKESMVEIMREGQLSLFDGSGAEQGSSAAEQGSSAAEQGSSAAEQGSSAAEQGSSAAEQGSSAAEQGSSAAEQGSSVAELTVRRGDWNNPKEQSKTTAKNNNPKSTPPPPTVNGRFANSAGSVREHKNGGGGGELVNDEILAWMGFNGRLNHVDQNPSTLLLLSWAMWVKVRGEDESKNPIGVARSKWRQGEFPEITLVDYAKSVLSELNELAVGDVRGWLDDVVDDYEQPSFDAYIPNKYKDIISR